LKSPGTGQSFDMQQTSDLGDEERGRGRFNTFIISENQYRVYKCTFFDDHISTKREIRKMCDTRSRHYGIAAAAAAVAVAVVAAAAAAAAAALLAAAAAVGWLRRPHTRLHGSKEEEKVLKMCNLFQ
jgi:hypothetical protein